MAGNSFGTLFRITTWGESHGPAVGVVIDGCPAGVAITIDDIQREVDRRKPSGGSVVGSRAASSGVTARQEEDRVEILSGIFEGVTTGMPIALLVKNKDARPSDYDALKDIYRPGHADMTYDMKYGIRDYRGGGRASGRETVARVMAGAVAKCVLRAHGAAGGGTAGTAGTAVVARGGGPVEIIGHTVQIGPYRAEKFDSEEIERNGMRCGDADAGAAMAAYVEEVRAARDSIGGVIEVIIRGAPADLPANALADSPANTLAGLGEPVFDRLNADLGKALFSIPAVKSVSFGRGMEVATMKGSEHNAEHNAACDKTCDKKHSNAGGILGGISTGDEIRIQIAIKPPSSIGQKQAARTRDGTETEIEIEGRHDACIVPRIIPVAESMIAIVLADHLLRNRAARI